MENVKYIPGDLVKVYDYDCQVIKVTTNTRTIDVKVLGYTKNIIFAGIHLYTAKPYPLTTEILKKNGWKQVKHIVDEDGYQYYLYENENNLFPEIQYYPKDDDWHKEEEFSIFWGDTEIRPDVHYLHELQHLLFGLGLDSSLKV